MPAVEERTIPDSTAPQFLLSERDPAARATNWLAYRLNNTGRKAGELLRDPRALILENALIDTGRPLAASIPDHLRAAEEPGSYVVQARGLVDEPFRQALKSAGAEVVSYLPNNAYLVRASAVAAGQLRSHPRTQAVLAWEPYYKLKAELLKLAVERHSLPEGAWLNVVVYADARAETESALGRLGAEVVGEWRSPFGPVLTVKPAAENWVEIARLPGVELVERYAERTRANDLSRETTQVAEDSVATTNYLGLTGNAVGVNVNDTGVDASHPDLEGRVFGDTAASLVDTDGHGTHVAGIIAGSGARSLTVSNAQGSVMPAVAGQFRGRAPAARLYSINSGLTGLGTGDAYLQEAAARTNALISNNSWYYAGANTYNLAAANFDAAVRDALPEDTGSQPVLFVFAAGNSGKGDDFGLGGLPETILSPGTAKNVITVGAVEQWRNITNEVVNANNVTNQVWRGMTSSDTLRLEVARFSSRGNVGIGIEGDYGRYKPDLVAPGTFVISTRSGQWDEQAYYNPTNHHLYPYPGVLVLTNQWFNSITPGIPQNAVAATIRLLPNADSPQPFPDLPVFVRLADIPTTNQYDFVQTNFVTLPVPPRGVQWYYSVGNGTTQNVNLDILVDIVTTNDQGNYFEVLSNLNNTLGPFYRYESGTSMAAAEASGTLALMQEFFEQRLGVTNSPALMKALLINGARQVSSIYNFQVQSEVNDQGWGVIQLTNSVPASLTTNGANPAAAAALRWFDQSPTNALATGQSLTRLVNVSEFARDLDLRITLVWTDPPGNPAAGVKLVNDLDLVVTNLESGEIFLGNDIGPSVYNLNPWNTNTAPNADAVNNVENVYLRGPLGSNYAVTVVGRAVNVNAVTAHTNNVAQDYALVISCGNGEEADALAVTSQPLAFTNRLRFSTVTNSFPKSPSISGSLLLGQHVGANTPLLGTTNGMTNQWHFYVVTNTTTFTNAAFVTLLASDLALPRLGVREVDLNNATRVESDIDLYVTLNPGLTNLDALAVAGADKSRGRSGTEMVVYSNSVSDRVYYVGVKAEDQMAAEYAFLAVFSLNPFSTRDPEGNLIVNGLPLPADVPDGSPGDPGAALVLGLAVEPISVRRVVVTNAFFHENPGDLLDSLSHNRKFAVLNNHVGELLGSYRFVYEDNEEEELKRSVGPASLREFVGEEGLGVWLFAMVDNSLGKTGEVQELTLRLEPQDLSSDAAARLLRPGAFTYDFINVPLAATNLTVCVSGNLQPVELYVRRGEFPSRTQYDHFLTVPAGGGCLVIDKSDLPPLTSGRYFIGVYNSSGQIQNVVLTATVEVDPASVVPLRFGAAGNQPLKDDAATYASLFVSDRARIANIDVGVSLNHERMSDLALTLISPRGTRVLLMENRGGTNSSGAGTSSLVTNVTTTTTGFESVPAGNYVPGTAVEDWLVMSNTVTVLADAALAHDGSQQSLALRAGAIQRNFATVPGADCTLTFAYRKASLEGIVSWWPGESNTLDVVGGRNGTLVGGAGFAPGMVNTAFNLDGLNDSVDFGGGFNFQVFSVSMWVNAAASQNPFADIMDNNHNITRSWVIQYENVGSRYHWGCDAFGIIPFDLTPNTWQHLAVTVDSARLARVFVNGVQVGSLTGAAPIPYDGTQFLRLGRWGSGGRYWRGQLDEVTIYNRSLSTSEIQSIYAAGPAGKCGLTLAPAPCQSGQGQVVVTGLAPSPIVAFSTNWFTNTLNFTAAQTNTLVELAALGGNSGILLDSIILKQTVVTTQYLYLTFTENTNLTVTPIKFAAPPFTPTSTATNFFLSGFEPAAAGFYTNLQTFDGWTVQTTNPVEVIADSALANTGTNSLSLRSGGVQRILPTIKSRDYRIEFAYRSAGALNPTHWWPGDGDATDRVGGSHGVLRNGATATAVGKVGQAFDFDGVNDSVDFGDVGNFRHDDFTVDFWIRTTSARLEAVLGRRPVCNDTSSWHIRLGVYAPGFIPGVLAIELTQPGNINAWYSSQTVNDGNWHHVTLVRQGTNDRLYIDGVLDSVNSIPDVNDLNNAVNFIAGTEVCVGVDGTFHFTGQLDEIAFYDAPLTAFQIQDIYAAGADGKCGTSMPPEPCSLFGAQVSVPGVAPVTVTGSSTNWQTNALTFTATQDGTPLDVAALPGGPSGVLLDTFTLHESGGALYYLPEESLATLVDQEVHGLWRLEILDTRTGATNLAALADWQLQFVYQTDIPLPGSLEHGVPQTNSVPPGQIAYYVVDVPAWARFATNRLLSATGPLNILFNQNTPPTGTNLGDFTLIGPATSGSATLGLSTAPPLVPGARYYLGVQNPGATTVTYALQVDFDITPLFNGIPVTSTLDVGALPRYFSFDVSTNAAAVTYQLTNLSGNVNLLARRTGLPAPGNYDYGSFNPGTADEEIIVFTNSAPVPLSAGRWYLGVFNADAAPVTYTIVAAEYTNLFPNIITLTNGIPYYNIAAGGGSDYYRYRVTTNAVRAQFEINGPTTDLTLVARKGLPLPDLGLFDYQSANPFLNDELIVVLTNSAPVPLSAGDWFLTAVNLGAGPASYAIKATEWPWTGRPLVIVDWGVVSNEFCLTWTSLPGAHYYVDGLTNVWSTNWMTLSPTLTATDYLTTWCLPLPSAFQYFRVAEGLALNLFVPPPVITSITRTNGAVLIEWLGPTNVTYGVEWTPALVPVNWTAFTNVVSSATGQFGFVDDGTQTGGLGPTRFYRLVQLP